MSGPFHGSCANRGDAIVDARRPAAESTVAECLVLAACACQKHWSYTTRNTSETYAFNGTCANPGGDRMAAWCPVDAGTCAHQPRQGRIVSKGPYNLCNAQRDTTTLDTRALSAHLGTAMAIALYPQMKIYGARPLHAWGKCRRA